MSQVGFCFLWFDWSVQKERNLIELVDRLDAMRLQMMVLRWNITLQFLFQFG